jgi:hypothetical protein
MKNLSFTNRVFCVNTDVEVTNRKTLIPAATSEASRVAVPTCQHLKVFTAYDKIGMFALHYPISL